MSLSVVHIVFVIMLFKNSQIKVFGLFKLLRINFTKKAAHVQSTTIYLIFFILLIIAPKGKPIGVAAERTTYNDNYDTIKLSWQVRITYCICVCVCVYVCSATTCVILGEGCVEWREKGEREGREKGERGGGGVDRGGKR